MLSRAAGPNLVDSGGSCGRDGGDVDVAVIAALLYQTQVPLEGHNFPALCVKRQLPLLVAVIIVLGLVQAAVRHV